MPNFQDRVIQGAGTRGSVGTKKSESLPNITGWVYGVLDYPPNESVNAGGIFRYVGYDTMISVGVQSDVYISTVAANANLSSSVYQDAAPVQQKALLIQCCIKY